MSTHDLRDQLDGLTVPVGVVGGCGVTSGLILSGSSGSLTKINDIEGTPIYGTGLEKVGESRDNQYFIGGSWK